MSYDEVALAAKQRHAHEAAAAVTDPEMPMLTLEDLGVLRSVELDELGHVIVTITPTYSGCPAMATMRDDVMWGLHRAGIYDATVRISLSPAWTSDWITDRGRQALADHGISGPGPAPRSDPVALTLIPVARENTCPRCGSVQVALSSEFGPTACKALYRCRECLEPFEHMKEI